MGLCVYASLMLLTLTGRPRSPGPPGSATSVGVVVLLPVRRGWGRVSGNLLSYKLVLGLEVSYYWSGIARKLLCCLGMDTALLFWVLPCPSMSLVVIPTKLLVVTSKALVKTNLGVRCWLGRPSGPPRTCCTTPEPWTSSWTPFLSRSTFAPSSCPTTVIVGCAGWSSWLGRCSGSSCWSSSWASFGPAWSSASHPRIWGPCLIWT